MENFFVLLAICAGNHPWPVNSSHKGQWCRALMFSLICVWINGWVNNGEAGDLRHDHVHCDVTVMFKASISNRNWDSNGSSNSSLKNYSKMPIIYVFVMNRSYFFHLIGNQLINWHITICCSICSWGKQIWSPQTANSGLRGPGTHTKLTVPSSFLEISTMHSVFLKKCSKLSPCNFANMLPQKHPLAMFKNYSKDQIGPQRPRS